MEKTDRSSEAKTLQTEIESKNLELKEHFETIKELEVKLRGSEETAATVQERHELELADLQKVIQEKGMPFGYIFWL